MSIKYTPGPWVAEFFVNKESDLIQPLVIGHKRWALCSPKKNTPILIAGVFLSAPNEADARLIAAAPDLLEALKELEDNATQAAAFIPHILLTTAIEKARLAIKKAEGEK